MGDVLSRRALNRATSQRQLLLTRAAMSVPKALERVVGMQAQLPNPPYFGLWSRLEGFTPDRLSDLVTARKVVRIALMRGTLHLVTAADCLFLRPLVQPVYERALKGLPCPGRSEVAAVVDELTGAEPMTYDALGKALAQRFPGYPESTLRLAARVWSPLIQVPPRGLWGRSGPAAHTTVETWLGKPLRGDASVDEMFLRYLAGFGPAGVKDAQAWSGLTSLKEVAQRLRPKLRVFRDETGVELFDLPRSPRPDPETLAPVRFLADWDNMLLSYADRARIIDEDYRKQIYTVNGIMPATFTIDGFVAGVWKTVGGNVTLTPNRKLSKADRAAVEAEAVALLGFAGLAGEPVWGQV